MAGASRGKPCPCDPSATSHVIIHPWVFLLSPGFSEKDV